jgi:uncharacterized repeat protein (TIGR01451 family)
MQVPLSALSAGGYDKNVLVNTPIRLITGSSTTEQRINKDISGQSTDISAALFEAGELVLENSGSFGFLYDTRDLDPSSNLGIWQRNETVTVNGSGWPVSTSSYYNSGERGIQIIDSNNTLIWNSTVTSSSNGTIINEPIWTIPLGIPAGIYSILVQNPINSSVWDIYDHFTIIAPTIFVQNIVNIDTLSSGTTASYSIKIWNTGNTVGTLTEITDTPPLNFDFIPGSVTGFTFSDPVISDYILTWPGIWSIPILSQPSDTLNLSFDVNVGIMRGTFFNNALISGADFEYIFTGDTAPVTVTAPQLQIIKDVDQLNAAVGDTLTYTISYSNIGDGSAHYIFIQENIPVNTTYVINSADALNMTILFSHDGGFNWDSSQSSPITNLSFQRSIPLGPGLSGQATFKVVIQ